MTNSGPRCPPQQGGSVSLELAILAPLLLMVMLLIVAFGRQGQVTSAVSQAAMDAARGATAARSISTAKQSVPAIIKADLASTPKDCRDNFDWAVTTNAPDHETLLPSDPYNPDPSATGTGLDVVTVTVSCTVKTAELSLIGIGSMKFEETFSSPVPANYGVYTGE